MAIYILLSFAFLLLYFESSIVLGGVPLSQWWKGCLIIALLYRLCRTRMLVKKDSILILFVVLYLIVDLIFRLLWGGVLYSLDLSLVLSMVTVSIMMMLSNWFKFEFQEIQKYFVFFVCFSFLPFVTGALSSLNDGYDLLGQFGVERVSLVGIFSGPHAASGMIALALTLAVQMLFRGTLSGLGGFLLIVFLLYCLVTTLSRTGMAAALAGAGYMLWSEKGKRFYALIFVIGLMMLAALAVVFNVVDAELIINKVTGNRLRNSEFDSFSTLGSGRVGIWGSAIQILGSMTPLELLFGLGYAGATIAMSEVWGSSLIAHNGLLELLLTKGLTGTALILIFLLRYFSFALARVDSENRAIVIAIALVYLCFFLFQSLNNYYIVTSIALLFCSSFGVNPTSQKQKGKQYSNEH